MLLELAKLGKAIGIAYTRLQDTDHNDEANELIDSFDHVTRALGPKSNAERSALMLLSAGQELYGESDGISHGASSWVYAKTLSEELLGIIEVELTN